MADWKLISAAAAGSCIGAAAIVGCKNGPCQAGLSRKTEGTESSGGAAAASREAELSNHKLSYERDYTRWTATDVAAWLLQNNVSAGTALKFEGEDIDGCVLSRMTSRSALESLLAELGISKVGDRYKIQAAVDALDEDSSPPAPQTAHAVNPLSPEAGILARESATKATSPAAAAAARDVSSPVRAAAAAPAAQRPSKQTAQLPEEAAIAAKYAQIVEGNIESLDKVGSFITSAEFKAEPLAQRKAQLKKVVDLLTNLLSFSDDVPSEYSGRLVEKIQSVYEVVKSYGDLDSVSDGPSGGGDSAKSGRIARIRAFKKTLAETPDDDLGAMMEKLRVVVGDIDNCSDMDEVHELNAVFELLQQRNASLQKRAEALKKEKDEAESEGIGSKLQLVVQLLGDDYSSLPLAKQEEHLRLAVHILSEYMNTLGSTDPTIAVKLGQLVKAKRMEFEQNKQDAANKASAGGDGGEAGSVRAKLSGLVELMKNENFDRVDLEKRLHVMQSAFTTLDSLTKRDLEENHVLTAELVELLKKKHTETAGAAAGLMQEEISRDADAEEGEEEEEDDDEDTEEMKRQNAQAPQSEVNLLPKVYSKLKSDTFVNGTSQFEFDTILWVVAQISQVLNAVLEKEQFVEMMEPVHKMLMLRMDETSAFPASSHKSDETFKFTADEQGYRMVLSTSDADVSEVMPMVTSEAADGTGPLSALLVGCDSPQGTEGVEIQHLAYMLRKHLGYDVVMLTGPDATALTIEAAMREPHSLVYVRAGLDSDRSNIALSDGTVSLEWLQEHMGDCGTTIVDLFHECYFATKTEDVKVAVSEEAVTKVVCTCSWLFDGIFTPLIAELLSSETASPRTPGALVRQVQNYFLKSDAAAEETGCESVTLHAPVISNGPVPAEVESIE